MVYQAPLSMGILSPKNTGVGCHALPPPRDIPDSGIEAASLKSPALAEGFFTTSTTWEAPPSSAPTSYKPLQNFKKLTEH